MYGIFSKVQVLIILAISWITHGRVAISGRWYLVPLTKNGIQTTNPMIPAPNETKKMIGIGSKHQMSQQHNLLPLVRLLALWHSIWTEHFHLSDNPPALPPLNRLSHSATSLQYIQQFFFFFFEVYLCNSALYPFYCFLYTSIPKFLLMRALLHVIYCLMFCVHIFLQILQILQLF